MTDTTGASATDMAAQRLAVSDPTRARALSCFYLRDRWSPRELAVELSMQPEAPYFHLRLLADVGLVEESRVGSASLDSSFVCPELSKFSTRWNFGDQVPSGCSVIA